MVPLCSDTKGFLVDSVLWCLVFYTRDELVEGRTSDVHLLGQFVRCLTTQSTLVTIPTSNFSVKKVCVLYLDRIYVFHIILCITDEGGFPQLL